VWDGRSSRLADQKPSRHWSGDHTLTKIAAFCNRLRSTGAMFFGPRCQPVGVPTCQGGTGGSEPNKRTSPQPLLVTEGARRVARIRNSVSPKDKPRPYAENEKLCLPWG
jgi:hypothetical protein